MKRKSLRFPIQLEDAKRAKSALDEALGMVYGSQARKIDWTTPWAALNDLSTALRAVDKANAEVREVVENIGRRRATDKNALPDMVPQESLNQTLNVITAWRARDIVLDRVTESVRAAARKVRYPGDDDATVDHQAWRIAALLRYAKKWGEAGADETDPERVAICREIANVWERAANEAKLDGENDAAVKTKQRLHEAEQEEKTRRLLEERAELARQRAEAAASAAAEEAAVEETIRRHNAPLRPIRDGAKRTYLINVASAKGETDARGYLKREAFAIGGRVWWPLGVNRAAEDDGKGGYRATTKRKWVITVLPVGMTAGMAFNVKEAEDMAKTLAPRFREEVENIGEIRSSAPSATAPLARIVSEYNERKRVDADTEKRLAEQRSRAEAEAVKKEIEEEEAEFEARAAKKEKEEAARAERTERQRKQAEREREAITRPEPPSSGRWWARRERERVDRWDALVFALSGENEEAVQATFDEVAIQNPQFARVLRRAMVAQKGK